MVEYNGCALKNLGHPLLEAVQPLRQKCHFYKQICGNINDTSNDNDPSQMMMNFFYCPSSSSSSLLFLFIVDKNGKQAEPVSHL
ncbi:hypothetical protein T07_12176 [Trichinella nelsoni]|uniref:Uncharacterized protein n=1 Tax=Trichinella nelsoni TaxID=6336 RepID=A0A0V0SP92_9BILA|nr:hypothetical protein T07_12176 [Trichinella nelsoni]